MADLASAPTAARCQVNATLSASIDDASQLLSFYQQWSDKYDEDFRPEHYVGPRLAVETVCEFIAVEQRSKVTVVDVAAGTGLVGLELSKNGFNAIDAVDGSEAMLAKLKQKGVYRQATQAMLGMAGSNSILPENEYDVVTCSGGFVPGHLPAAALDDLIRLCKPGGLIVIVMRFEYLTICEDYAGMEAKLNESLDLVKRRISPQYLLDKEGLVLAYRKK